MSNLKNNSVVAMLVAVSGNCPAGSPEDSNGAAFRQMLNQKYPATRFDAITPSPLPGIREVWMGENVAYVSDDGRHFLFGHLYDMQTQQDLTVTSARQAGPDRNTPITAIRFANLPLPDAIQTVQGDGARKLAVFSDPLCTYCRQLEAELSKLNNVTVYTFMIPMALHTESASIAEAIWCAPDRSASWRTFMLKREHPQRKSCASPVQRNLILATQAGIGGTPFILFSDGTHAAGLIDAVTLEHRLAGD